MLVVTVVLSTASLMQQRICYVYLLKITTHLCQTSPDYYKSEKTLSSDDNMNVVVYYCRLSTVECIGVTILFVFCVIYISLTKYFLDASCLVSCAVNFVDRVNRVVTYTHLKVKVIHVHYDNYGCACLTYRAFVCLAWIRFYEATQVNNNSPPAIPQHWLY